MKLEELMEMTLKEVLETFVGIRSLECCYWYGIAKADDVEKLFENYNIEEYEEAFDVANLIEDELLVSHQEEVLTYDVLERIMENLGISKKEEVK